MFSVITNGTCGYVIKTIDMITLMLMTHAPSVSKIGQAPFSFGQLLMVKKLQQLCTLERWKVENVYSYLSVCLCAIQGGTIISTFWIS